MKINIKKILKSQWSFFWAGIVFGIAQIIYMWGHMIDALMNIVVMLEREPRIWAKYPLKLLIVSFIWWLIFSYWTRLAGGCTLNHLLGWVPMMNIHSTVALIFMGIGWLAAFWLMVKLNLARYFKHQETKCYVKHEYEKWNKDRDGITYDPNYNPWKRVATWVWLGFMLSLFGIALYGGIADPEWMQYLKKWDLHAMYKSIDHKWLFWVFVTLLAGIVWGFAMAKSWFLWSK